MNILPNQTNNNKKISGVIFHGEASSGFLLFSEHRPDSDFTSSYPDHTSTPPVLLAPPVNKQFKKKRKEKKLKQQLHRQTGEPPW